MVNSMCQSNTSHNGEPSGQSIQHERPKFHLVANKRGRSIEPDEGNNQNSGEETLTAIVPHRPDCQTMSSVEVDDFAAVPWRKWLVDLKDLPTKKQRSQMYSKIFDTSGRIKREFCARFVGTVHEMGLEGAKKDLILYGFLHTANRRKLCPELWLSPRNRKVEQRNLFGGTGFTYPDFRTLVDLMASGNCSYKERVKFLARFPEIFGSGEAIKAAFTSHARTLINQLPKREQNAVCVLLPKRLRNKIGDEDEKIDLYSAGPGDVDEPLSSTTTPSTNPPSDTTISIPEGRKTIANGAPEIDIWPHDLPQNYQALDRNEAQWRFESITLYVERRYEMELGIRNRNNSQKVMQALQAPLMQMDSFEVPSSRLLRELLAEIPGDNLHERLRNLGNSYHRDLIQMVLVYFLYTKLSATHLFPESHRCLDTLHLIQAAEPLKDFTILRKNVILNEMNKRSEDFDDNCQQVAEQWAIEADMILSKLTPLFNDGKNQFETLTVLFSKLLRLHARFEAESKSVQYDWTPPSVSDRPTSKGSVRWTRYTRMFGVTFTSHDGQKVPLVKADIDDL